MHIYSMVQGCVRRLVYFHCPICFLLYCIVLYCIVLYCIVLYCIVLYCIVLYCIVLYCIVLYCIVLYCIVLYCIVLYCIVLYCIVLYCIVLYCIVLYCIDSYPLVVMVAVPSGRHGQCVCVCDVCNGWSGEARGGLEHPSALFDKYRGLFYLPTRIRDRGLNIPSEGLLVAQMIIIQPLFRNRRCHFD